MKILVTGSKGVLASSLIPMMERLGYEVWGCDVVPGYGERYIQSNISSGGDLEKAFQQHQFKFVYHAAALYGRIANEASPILATESNIIGLTIIIELCKRYNSKMIFFSSSEIYGGLTGDLHEERKDLNPNNLYGLLKLQGEQLIQYNVKEYGLNAVILRLNMAYSDKEVMGEYRSALVRFCEKLLKKEKIQVYPGVRSWIYIDDTLKVLLHSLMLPSGTVMNVGHPQAVETLEVAKWLCEQLNLEPSEYIEMQPLPIRMTKDKFINVSKMFELTEVCLEVSIWEGAVKVLESVKERLKL